MEFLFGLFGSIFAVGLLFYFGHNLTAPGPNGAWPFGGDW